MRAALVGSYLVLLRVGFTLPNLLPNSRCALTAPFHPYRDAYASHGGLFSVALAVGFDTPQALPGTLPYGARTFLPTKTSLVERLSSLTPGSIITIAP